MKAILRIILVLMIVVILFLIWRNLRPIDGGEGTPIPESTPAQTAVSLDICSFNIQFLGSSKERDNVSLAWAVSECEIVAIQELVAPPFPGQFPDGSPYKPDPQSAAFFQEMDKLGYAYVLSEEDTGTGERLHVNSSSTEWWAVFYKAEWVEIADTLPMGFLADDRSDHPDYERVPYAFPFRTRDGKSDFVLINVHFKPGDGPSERARRKEELNAIFRWIDGVDEREGDFIILGDMNFKNRAEIEDILPEPWLSLNDEAKATNTNINGPKPYDHILFRPQKSREIDRAFDFKVLDLIQSMGKRWRRSEAYPGDPYDHNRFRRYFSDHHPIMFRWHSASADDD